MTDVLRASGTNRWHMAIWGAAAALLVVPLVAMQFTAEVAWETADFVAFGAMLVTACGAIELALRMMRRTSHAG